MQKGLSWPPWQMFLHVKHSLDTLGKSWWKYIATSVIYDIYVIDALVAGLADQCDLNVMNCIIDLLEERRKFFFWNLFSTTFSNCKNCATYLWSTRNHGTSPLRCLVPWADQIANWLAISLWPFQEVHSLCSFEKDCGWQLLKTQHDTGAHFVAWQTCFMLMMKDK